MMDAQAVAQVEHLLVRMRAAMHAAQGSAPHSAYGAHEAPAGDFAVALAQSLEKVSQVETHAYSQATALERGVQGIHLSDVMIDLQKANIAFQMTLQVRNRLVEAYKEVASLAI